MRKLLVILSIILMCAAGTFASAAHAGVKLGKGDYFVVVAPIFSETGDVTTRSLTSGQLDFMLKLDDLCRIDAKKYSPSEFKTVFLTILRNAPGAFVGGGAGAAAAGFLGNGVTFAKYGAYNGVATAGGSFGAGFTGQAYGKKGFMGMCMTIMLTEARKQGLGRYLDGVNIVYNTFPVNGHAIKKSDLPTTPFLQSGAADRNDADDDSVPPPPPPRALIASRSMPKAAKLRLAAFSLFAAQTYFTSTSSTSKMSVAFAGMAPGTPWLPYAKSAGMMRRRFPPTFMPATPKSHPLMTWPAPRLKVNGWPWFALASKTLPSGSMPI